jgi:hypothetical protein
VADLDADLQLGNSKVAPSAALFREDHLQYDADIQLPPTGGFESLRSYCTCEAGTATIHTTGVTAFLDHLEVTFNANVVLSGPALVPANWYISVTGPGRAVQVGSVEVVSSDTVRLGVTAQTLDAAYTLNLPSLGITSDAFGIFTGLYSLDFLGVPTPVNVQMIRAVDAHHIDVIFAIAVDETSASDPTNYTLSNGLTVTGSHKITDYWYRLTNQPRQVDGTSYTLTVSNVDPK